jgi:hypothetical protein
MWGRTHSSVQPGKARQFAEVQPLFDPSSPNLELDLAVLPDKLKVGPVGRDETGAVGAGSERDENVEMQVTQFMRREAVIGTNARQNFP